MLLMLDTLCFAAGDPRKRGDYGVVCCEALCGVGVALVFCFGGLVKPEYAVIQVNASLV